MGESNLSDIVAARTEAAICTPWTFTLSLHAHSIPLVGPGEGERFVHGHEKVPICGQ